MLGTKVTPAPAASHTAAISSAVTHGTSPGIVRKRAAPRARASRWAKATASVCPRLAGSTRHRAPYRSATSMTSPSVVTTKMGPGRAAASAASTSSSIARARAWRSSAPRRGIRRCLALTRSLTGTAARTSILDLGDLGEDAAGERDLGFAARHDDRGEGGANPEALHVGGLDPVPLVEHEDVEPGSIRLGDAG